MVKIITPLYLLVVLLFACGNSNTSNQEEEQLPVATTDSCARFPKPIGFVNDFEKLFSDEQERTLDSVIKAFEKQTSVEIAVVTLDTLFTSDDDMFLYTLDLANCWGVGKKDKDNGVLVTISARSKSMYIQNGTSIEEIFTDQKTQQVIDSVFIPRYKEGKYFEGTLNGIKAITEILK